MAAEFNLRIKVDSTGAVAGVESVEKALRKTRTAVQEMNTAMRHVFGVYAIKEAVVGVYHLADSYVSLRNKLNVVSRDQAHLNQTMRETFEVAQRTRTSWETTATIYSRLARNTKELGVSQRELLTFTETLNKAVIVGGATTLEANASILQLSQGMASGKLAGEELRAVMEQLPIVAQTIAKGMGVATGELYKLARQGKLTPQVILAAFRDGKAEIDELYKKTVPTMAQGFEMLTNALRKFFGEAGSGSGIIEGFSKLLKYVADHVEQIGAVVIIAAKGLGLLLVIRTVTAAWTLFNKALLMNPLSVFIIGMTMLLPLLDSFSDKLGTVQKGIIIAATAITAMVMTANPLIAGLAALAAAYALVNPGLSDHEKKILKLYDAYFATNSALSKYRKEVLAGRAIADDVKERTLKLEAYAATIELTSTQLADLKVKQDAAAASKPLGAIDQFLGNEKVTFGFKNKLEQIRLEAELTKSVIGQLQTNLENFLKSADDVDPTKGGLTKLLEKWKKDATDAFDKMTSIQTLIEGAGGSLKIDPKSKYVTPQLPPGATEDSLIGTSKFSWTFVAEEFEKSQNKVIETSERGGKAIVKYRERLQAFTNGMKDLKKAFEDKAFGLDEYLRQKKELEDAYYGGGRGKVDPMIAAIDALMKKSNEAEKALIDLNNAEKLLSKPKAQRELFKRGVTADTVLSNLRTELDPKLYPQKEAISDLIEMAGATSGLNKEIEHNKTLLKIVNDLNDRGANLRSWEIDQIDHLLTLGEKRAEQLAQENAILNDLNDPLAKYTQYMEALNRLTAAGKVTVPQYQDLSGKAKDRFRQESDPEAWAREKKLVGEVNGALKDYNLSLRAIDQAVKDHKLSFEQAATAARDAGKAYQEAMDAKYQANRYDMGDTGDQMMKGWDEAVGNFRKDAMDLSDEMSTLTETALGNFETFFLTAIEHGKWAWDELYKGMVAELNDLAMKLIEQAILTKLLGGNKDVGDKMYGAAAALTGSHLTGMGTAAALSLAAQQFMIAFSMSNKDTPIGGVNAALGTNILGAILPALGGQANGGSYRVGGSGGPDSQLRLIPLSPRERIDFTPEGKNPPGAGTNSGPQTTRVSNHFYTDRRDLLKAIRTPDGKREVLNVIRENIGEVSALLQK